MASSSPLGKRNKIAAERFATLWNALLVEFFILHAQQLERLQIKADSLDWKRDTQGLCVCSAAGCYSFPFALNYYPIIDALLCKGHSTVNIPSGSRQNCITRSTGSTHKKEGRTTPYDSAQSRADWMNKS